MVVNQDHYINRVFAEPGEYELTVDEFDTPYVLLAARVLVDATDPDDVAQANADPRRLASTPGRAEPLSCPTTTRVVHGGPRRASWPRRSEGFHGTHGMFGTKEDVDPHAHLLGTASGLGWSARAGGVLREPRPGTARRSYTHHRQDVPVDAFWSITVYGRDGFLDENDLDAYSVNSVSGTKNADGSITVHLRRRQQRLNPSRWRTVGTTPSACTGHGPRSSTAPGSLRASPPFPNHLATAQKCRSVAHRRARSAGCEPIGNASSERMVEPRLAADEIELIRHCRAAHRPLMPKSARYRRLPPGTGTGRGGAVWAC